MFHEKAYATNSNATTATNTALKLNITAEYQAQ